MSWRSSAQRTGENAAPLTKVRRWGGGEEQQQPPAGFGPPVGDHAPPPPLGYDTGAKRSREEPTAAGSAQAPRKRRSRWGDAPVDAASGVATAIGANVPAAELERYALQVRLDEIARKLATGNVVPPERERSPSPPPTYDGQGRRTNTREVRYTKKLEHERVALMDKAMKLDPNYRPPAEYHAAKRNMKPSEKVYLPLKEFPDINFFGLLVGPRGNTLKKMERESGAKISIRGKGSVKEGKGRPGDEDDEEMHCVVTADDNEKVKKCIKLINLVIETAASTPEAQNDHKRNQLRELAALNGTLRDDEGQVCQNCGQKGHRRFMCPEERNVTAHIICHRCGGQGHLARDCTQQPGMMGGGGVGSFGPPGGQTGPGGKFDSEYANLMAELGEGGAPSGAAQAHRPGMPGQMQQPSQQQGQLFGPDGKKIPPWRDPSMWNPPGHGGRMMGGGGMGMGHMGGQRFGGAPGGMALNGGMSMDQGWGARQQQQQWGAQQGYGQQAGYAQPMPDANGQPDYTKEWEEYHRQQALAVAAGSPQQAVAGTAAAGGQPDYTKQWEEYYRLQAAAAATGGAAPADPATATAATGDGKDYTKEWEEYNRQQAALAAAAAAGGASAGGAPAY